MRNGFLCCIVAVLLLPGVSFAGNTIHRLYVEPGTGLLLSYYLVLPADYDPAVKYPLVLALHGAGTFGSYNLGDNITSFGYFDGLASALKLPQYQSFLLFPQAAYGSGWASWYEEPSDNMRMVLGTIDVLENQYSIDDARLYITGASMGGYGTWDAIWKDTSPFAAAVPICGGGDTDRAPQLVDQNIWAFHAADDGVVSVTQSREMIAAIRAAGGDPLYTEYATGGHLGCIYQAYSETALYDWMFSKSLPVPEPGSVCLALSGVIVFGCYWARRRFVKKTGRN